jgi:hypothetical protein
MYVCVNRWDDVLGRLAELALRDERAVCMCMCMYVCVWLSEMMWLVGVCMCMYVCMCDSLRWFTWWACQARIERRESCVYVCVCMCACVFGLCVSWRDSTDRQIDKPQFTIPGTCRLDSNMHLCTYRYVYIHTYTHIHTHTWISWFMCGDVSALFMCVCVYVYMLVCGSIQLTHELCLCVYVCMYVCLCVWLMCQLQRQHRNMHLYTYTHTRIHAYTHTHIPESQRAQWFMRWSFSWRDGDENEGLAITWCMYVCMYVYKMLWRRKLVLISSLSSSHVCMHKLHTAIFINSFTYCHSC